MTEPLSTNRCASTTRCPSLYNRSNIIEVRHRTSERASLTISVRGLDEVSQ